MKPRNPAALAWMLVLGHEARATAEDEREVRQMAAQSQMEDKILVLEAQIAGLKAERDAWFTQAIVAWAMLVAGTIIAIYRG